MIHMINAAAPIAWWLADWTLRTTLLLVLAWLATKLLHKATAATRHLLWKSAIASALLLPLLAMTIPAWRIVPMIPAEWTRTPSSAVTTSTISSGQEPVGSPHRTNAFSSPSGVIGPQRSTDHIASIKTAHAIAAAPSAAHPPELQIEPLSLPAVIATLWLIGLSIYLFWLAIVTLVARRVLSQATPVTDPTAQRSELSLARSASSPWATLSPSINPLPRASRLL